MAIKTSTGLLDVLSKCGLDPESIKEAVQDHDHTLSVVKETDTVRIKPHRGNETSPEMQHLQRVINTHLHLVHRADEESVRELFGQYNGYSCVVITLPNKQHPMWDRFGAEFKDAMYYWAGTKEIDPVLSGIHRSEIAELAHKEGVPISEFGRGGAFFYKDSHNPGAINEYCAAITGE